MIYNLWRQVGVWVVFFLMKIKGLKCDVLFNTEYYCSVTQQLQLFLTAVLKVYLLFSLRWTNLRESLSSFNMKAYKEQFVSLFHWFWRRLIFILQLLIEDQRPVTIRSMCLGYIFFFIVVVHFEILLFDASNIDLFM